VGLIALGIGCSELWSWRFYWDDPLHREIAGNGDSLPILEILQRDRTVHLVFACVFLVSAALVSVPAFALLRQRATENLPNEPRQPTGHATGSSPSSAAPSA
jgi:hypothetical protein